MIHIEDMSGPQVVRQIPNLIEPFIAERVKKENHTYFVYRCSDYQSMDHLMRCHLFRYDDRAFQAMIEKYWSAIDIIHLKVPLPEFSPTKGYFDKLRELELSTKKVKDIELYEVKLSLGYRKPIISTRTLSLARQLKSMGRRLHLVRVLLKGDAYISVSHENINEDQFKIETHYGRKGYHLRA